jgi:hypothetical protein
LRPIANASIALRALRLAARVRGSRPLTCSIFKGGKHQFRACLITSNARRSNCLLAMP